MAIYGTYARELAEAQTNNSILESKEFIEFESGNFNNLLESLNILAENNIISINEANFIEFLKDKWKKFVALIKRIWELIGQKITDIKATILLKKAVKLREKMQKLESGKHLFLVKYKNDSWDNFEDFEFDDFDDFDDDFDDDDEESFTDSATLLEAGDNPKINGGKIDLSWYAYISGSTLYNNDLKDAFNKCLGEDVEKLISDLEGLLKGNSNSLGKAMVDNFNDKLQNLHFTNDMKEGTLTVDTIHYKVIHHRLILSDNTNDIISRIIDHNNAIGKDIDYINSLKSRIFNLINTMNGVISSYKETDGEGSDIVKQNQLIQEKLRVLHIKLKSLIGELEQAASYYDLSCSKVDKLIARVNGK